MGHAGGASQPKDQRVALLQVGRGGKVEGAAKAKGKIGSAQLARR